MDLKIIGDGEARADLIRLLKNSKIQDRVTLLPSTLDIDSIYIESDLFVIPSLWEGCPNSLAEAMSHGLPAVGFNVDGVKQLIKHQKLAGLFRE